MSDEGGAAVASGFGEPWLDRLGDLELDVTSASRSIALAAAVESGLLDADREVLTTLRRFATLRQAVETSTVAVVLVQPANL